MAKAKRQRQLTALEQEYLNSVKKRHDDVSFGKHNKQVFNSGTFFFRVGKAFYRRLMPVPHVFIKPDQRELNRLSKK